MLLAILTLVAQVTPLPSPPPIPSPPLASPSASVLPSASPLPAVAPSVAPSALTVAPASIAITPAQQEIVHVSGAVLPLSVVSDKRLVSFAIDQNAATITTTATQATGTDTLHVTDASGATVDIPVRVAFLAGRVMKTATLKVTGSPLDGNWLAQQIQALVTRLTTAMPGAQTTIATVSPLPPSLVPGSQMQVNVPVQIMGGDSYFDVSDATTVTVQNVPMDTFLPQFLLYDDDPERVNADGVLYRGTIDAAHPSRLYYYHDDGPQPRRVVVVLSTSSADPASVQVIDATAGPNIDVMSVGHASSKSFLVLKPHNIGTIVDLDGTTPAVLHDLSMQYRQGVAGTVGLRVVAGGPVTVTVLAVSPGVDPRSLLQTAPLPGDGHHRTGVFSLANYGSASLAYAVGGPDAKVVYGDREPTPQNIVPNDAGHDYGDYGVVWNIDFTLTNPSPAPATVYLYERPIGGVVRSSFLLDGNIVDMGCVRVPKPYQIGAYVLEPSQTYRLNLQTMTDGGSNYPLEVGITQTVPEPSPPPITSPDGCFPKPQPALQPSPQPSPTGVPR